MSRSTNDRINLSMYSNATAQLLGTISSKDLILTVDGLDARSCEFINRRCYILHIVCS